MIMDWSVTKTRQDNCIAVIVVFTYFRAVSLKRMRRFELLTTDLSHALVVCDLTQIPAEGSGCRWG